MNTEPAVKPPQKPTQLLIPQSLAQKLVDYLAKQPYGEVFQLVDGIRAAPAAIVEEKKEA